MTSFAITTIDPRPHITVKPAHINGFRGAKLTRRGRFFSRCAVIASLLVLIASGYSAFSGASAESERSSAAHLEVVVVAPGESLWSIAKVVGGDVDETVARIIELNALASPNLEAGTRLIIPTRG